MDLDSLSSLESPLCLLGIGLEWRVGRNIRARGDGCAVTNTLGDLLALVDLSDLFRKQLVTPLTDVNDLCALSAPS